MNDQQRILEMIEKGQITAAEGMELLQALNATKETETPQSNEPITATKRNYKFLRIKVFSDNNTINVNVNVPLRLLTTIGEIAEKMTTIVPESARNDMMNKGINLSSIDYVKIIEEIINGTLDDPNIIDVDAWDESQNTMIRVKIYVD